MHRHRQRQNAWPGVPSYLQGAVSEAPTVYIYYQTVCFANLLALSLHV
jgi:hypothetical protein